MTPFDDKVGRVMAGGRGATPRHEPAELVEGEALDVTADGVTFTVPTWDGGRLRFGPAPWPRSRIEPVPDHQHGGSDPAGAHDHVETTPQTGDRLLVAFVWSGRERRRVPWVIAWW